MKHTFRTVTTALLSAGIAAGLSLTALAAPEDLFACTSSRDENNNITVSFKELELTLPAGWSQKCQISTGSDHATFMQIKSNQMLKEQYGDDYGGTLFEIDFSEYADFMDNPSYSVIGTTTSGYYYVSYPTDVRGYTDDADIMAEYSSMAEDVEWVVDTIKIKDEYVVSEFSSTDDYILPQSSSQYITENDLKSLTGNEIQMAINEIYARHHRKFVLTEVQDYFNSKAWYEGYIEAADFDASILNEYEGANIGLMVKYMSDNGIVSTLGSSSAQ